MKARIERRLVPLEGFEFRADGDKLPELVGYASVFNQETVIADWFDEWREEVSPGAFKKTIREGDIRALWNHDPSVVLGRNKAGTLELKEDDHGLYTVIRPPDNEWGRPVIDAIRRGDVSGMSITFQVIKQQMEYPPKGTEGMPKRTIKEARLLDVSPVTFPAFEQTEIGARSEAGGHAALGTALGLPLQEDVLLRAGALARQAQMGRELTAEERAMLGEAVAILESVREPMSVGNDTPHSPGATEAEPATLGTTLDHSPEARARRLRLMQMQIQGEY